MRSKRLITARVLAGLAGGLLTIAGTAGAELSATGDTAGSSGLARTAPAAQVKAPGPDDSTDRDRGDSTDRDRSGQHAVFVQTNLPLGNTIQVFERDNAGLLTFAGEYTTGGLGGATVGPPVDALASQGSLVLAEDLLFALNAGSNTVTMFRVDGSKLDQRQVIWSGGLLPVSVAVHDDLVYVLSAGGTGTVQGFRLERGELRRIEEANWSLGLGNANPPAFGTAPAQISVSPDGRFVLVTTKTKNIIAAFPIGRDGALPTEPVLNPDPGGPFGFTFDEAGAVLVAESGTNAVTRFELGRDGTLTQVGPSVPNNQQASCWIQRVGDFFYVANAGSSTISTYRVGDDGNLVLIAPVAVNTGGGSIDMAESDGYLYVQNAATGEVQGFDVGDDGSLSLVTTVGGLPVFANGMGMEGIAAS